MTRININGRNAYTEHIASRRWQQIRIAVFRRAGCACERCGCRRGLSVHHLTYAHLGGEPSADLILLCEICHRARHQQGRNGQLWDEEAAAARDARCDLRSHSMTDALIARMRAQDERARQDMERRRKAQEGQG